MLITRPFLIIKLVVFLVIAKMLPIMAMVEQNTLQQEVDAIQLGVTNLLQALECIQKQVNELAVSIQGGARDMDEEIKRNQDACKQYHKTLDFLKLKLELVSQYLNNLSPETKSFAVASATVLGICGIKYGIPGFWDSIKRINPKDIMATGGVALLLYGIYKMITHCTRSTEVATASSQSLLSSDASAQSKEEPIIPSQNPPDSSNSINHGQQLYVHTYPKLRTFEEIDAEFKTYKYEFF